MPSNAESRYGGDQQILQLLSMSDIHITSMEMHWTPNQLNQPIIEEFLHPLTWIASPMAGLQTHRDPHITSCLCSLLFKHPSLEWSTTSSNKNLVWKKGKRWQAKAKEVRIGSLLEHRYAWCLKKYRFEYSFDMEANIKNHYNYFLSALESSFK